MNIRSRFSLVAAMLLLVAMAACSDDSSPTDGGPNDDTPPGVTSVTPVDAYHVNIVFNEQVTKGTAEDEDNYTIAVVVPPVVSRPVVSAQGGPITIAGATLGGDKKTVTLTTSQTMTGADFDITVTGVSDVTGNKIKTPISKPFTGSDTPDDSAPTIVSRVPIPNGTNIQVGVVVTVTFSEAIQNATASLSSDGGPVAYSSEIDGATLTLTPDAPLAYNTEYTVDAAGTDFAGNTGTNSEWSFTTALNNDRTPPTVVSTSPANLAAGVDVNTNLSITFSEPVDTLQLNAELYPDAGDGTSTWSNGGKTITFDPTDPLLDDTQYTLTIFPNGVYDLAGNALQGVHTFVFTTASTLASGSIAGTITGDAGTPAADPTGATVIAADSSPFDGGDFNVFGTATVAGNNTYNVLYLPDGLYYLLAILDTSGNGNLDPSEGDAIGMYGVDIAAADLDPDSILVAGGAHVTGKNFKLIDPSAVSGTVQYNGSVKGSFPIQVGLFDTDGFLPTNEPVTGTETFGIDNEWLFNSIDELIPEGNYYVGAYMDINGNDTYDPGTDPAGFYGGLPTPTAINMTNGHDTPGIVIQITDPLTSAMSFASAVWPKSKHNPAFQRAVEIVRRSQHHATR